MDKTDPIQLVAYINKNLDENISITKSEIELKMGKDTARKLLNRGGYFLDNIEKQFVFNTDKLEQLKQKKAQIKKDKSSLNVDLQANLQIEQTGKNKPINKNKQGKETLIQQELEAIQGIRMELQAVLEQFKSVDKKIPLEAMDDIYTDFKGVLQGTTIQLYMEVWEKLDVYVRSQKVNKKTVVNQAIWDFLNR